MKCKQMARISLHHLLLLMEPDRSRQKIHIIFLSLRTERDSVYSWGTEKNILRDERKIEPK